MPIYAPDSDYRRSEIATWSGTASPAPVFNNYDPAIAYSNGAVIAATGVMMSLGIWLPAGAVITSLVFRSGSTAANVPTHWWFALYDTAATPNLLSQTADQTTTAWAINTNKDIALNAAQTIPVSGVYYAAIMMTATTQVTLQGMNNAGYPGAGFITGEAAKVQTSGSGLTTTAPATIATPATTPLMIPWVKAH